jgi:hypothetical protein
VCQDQGHQDHFYPHHRPESTLDMCQHLFYLKRSTQSTPPPSQNQIYLGTFYPTHTVALTPLLFYSTKKLYPITDESETLPTFHHHHFWFNSKRRHLCEFWFIIYSKTNIYGFNRVSSFT